MMGNAFMLQSVSASTQVHACKNMQQTLTSAVAKGWAVLGAAADTGSQDCRSVAVNKPTILVMGE